MRKYKDHARGISRRVAANDTGTMTAARYLTLRRQAAGRSIDLVAAELHRRALRDPKRFHPIGKRPVPGEARTLVELLERPFARARFRQTIEALAQIYPLDVDVYFQLAFEPADRHPTVCSACGSTPHDLYGTACHQCTGTRAARRAA